MPESLTEQDEIKLTRAAEEVCRMAESADEWNRDLAALNGADGGTLRATLGDRKQPTRSRINAFLLLIKQSRSRRDSSLAGLVLPLWEDSDEELARFAIEHAPAADPEVTAHLHALLDDHRPSRWATAAAALARRKDASIVTRLQGWFHGADRARRKVAWSCLCFNRLLEPSACHAMLWKSWEAGGRDDDDRAMLAVGLLGLGDQVGWDFLVDLARRADCYSAVWAAESVMEHDPGLGLELMLHVIDHGTTFEVRWGMVERIALAAGLPHVWTADGPTEARHWIAQEREKIQRGCAVLSLASLQAGSRPNATGER